ncbi:LAFE_0F16402g1_1 [Lachancea fermentati]|uniref:LAFE_0F16402g1_1 n=1 Tax=Lachancea fermentati TaxID=4955 RepID=A0A1G4MG58_LACFM|nr:LAFE_0F16402g1_1 [Lachancea fermentati]
MTHANAVGTFQEMLQQHARAMTYVAVHYETETETVAALLAKLHGVLVSGGKLVFVGCGKSFKIAAKTVAMLTSLGLAAALLHPTEALHGDMGLVRRNDAVLLCSSSGETPELAVFARQLAPAAPPEATVLVTGAHTCSLRAFADAVLLVPQPRRFQEATLQHGLQSPTVSTTLMLATLDCLCLALSELYFDGDLEQRRYFFKRMHPGGGIGKTVMSSQQSAAAEEARRGDVADDAAANDAAAPPGVAPIPAVNVAELDADASELEFLRTAVRCEWCAVDGARYSSHWLQQRYREWSAGPGAAFSVRALLAVAAVAATAS